MEITAVGVTANRSLEALVAQEQKDLPSLRWEESFPAATSRVNRATSAESRGLYRTEHMSCVAL